CPARWGWWCAYGTFRLCPPAYVAPERRSGYPFGGFGPGHSGEGRPQPPGRLLDDLGAFAEREPQRGAVRRAAIRMHERREWDADHARELREPPRERVRVGLAERARVGDHEVGAGGAAHREARGTQTLAEQVALGLERRRRLRVVRVGQLEPARDGRLERRPADVAQKLLHREHGVAQLRRGDEPADLPSGGRARLARARDGDDAPRGA